MPIIRRGMSSSATTATIVAAAVDQEVEITPPGTPEEADAAVAEAQEALDAATESGDADAIDDAQAELEGAVANQTAANDMVDSITGETMLAAGQLVSLVDVGGTLKYAPSGCLEDNYPDFFFGVVLQDAPQGTVVKVATGRGSIVTPLMEDDIELDPTKAVYLGATPGRATQNIGALPIGAVILKVGQSVTTTQMILNNDYNEINNFIGGD